MVMKTMAKMSPMITDIQRLSLSVEEYAKKVRNWAPSWNETKMRFEPIEHIRTPLKEMLYSRYLTIILSALWQLLGGACSVFWVIQTMAIFLTYGITFEFAGWDACSFFRNRMMSLIRAKKTISKVHWPKTSYLRFYYM